MRFYYISIISIFLLLVIWLIGTGLLAWFGSWLRKRMKHAWVVMVPLFLLLYIGPIAEELLIAWNFGQLCKKDAGIFICKTVEVEGFYDATRSSRGAEPSEAAKRSMDASGYRFHERPFPDTKGGPSQVVRFDKVDGDWKVSVLDRPTARYQYSWPHSHSPVSHKIVKHERVVVDTETDATLGRDVEYGRKAPWFFVGLDRPVMLCPAHHPLAKYGSILNQTLIPLGEKQNR